MSGKIAARREKESRWEMIRKKHINCINVTSETVRKFLTLDFVDEKKLVTGSGSGKTRSRLDPVVVMDLRHEMIKRRPKEDMRITQKIPSPPCNVFTMESNKPTELAMIEKELTKFKSDIQKMKQLTPRLQPPKLAKKKKKRSILIKLNNSGLFESLEDAGERTKDFYETAINAAESVSESQSSMAPEKPPQINPSVRFQDNIEVISYSREASTITGLDDELEDDIASLIEDEGEFFGLKENNKDVQKYLSYSEKTVTTTYQQFRYSSKNGCLSPNSSTTEEEEAESTESSELNFYQMFDMEEKEIKKDNELSDNNIFGESLTIKSINNNKSEKLASLASITETEDLVQEIIRVKAVSNVEGRHRVLRKYLMKWMHYTTIQKITKDSNLTTKSQRMTKIDAYLKKIREQKKLAKKEDKTDGAAGHPSRDNAIVIVKRYQSKMKLQQDIIEVQKLKLERQERMIAELRLSRLNEDAKKFKQDLREELRNAMRTGDVRLRARAKCLQVVGDVVEEEENRFVAYGNMIPKFLAKMQERAMERQMRHEQAKDRRLQLDHERDAQKQAFEEDKRKADEEAKKQRMLELQEKRRREKQEKVRREQERETFLENTRKANAFYRSYLLRRFGMDRLKKMVNRKKTLELKVTNLRKRLKMKACFKAWVTYTRTVWTLKYDKAQDYYELYLQRICVRVWRQNLQMARGQWLVAVDWHEMKLNEQFFSTWLALAREAKLAEETKLRHAEAHHKWHVMWKMLEHWQRLHSVLKLEKETEERRQRWRHKIWELLPDYTPAIE